MVVVGTPWSSRGFCGITHEDHWLPGSNLLCLQGKDTKGSWKLSAREPIGNLLKVCLAKCVACPRCHYISLSRGDRDCSWYTACPELRTRVGGYVLEHHTYQVRQVNGTTVDRVKRYLRKDAPQTFEDEGIKVEFQSGDAVCFGGRCVSWAAARSACRGPGAPARGPGL